MLQRSGPLWMADYWDRYIRDECHYLRVIDYIRKNPVKAGLVQSPEGWPWLNKIGVGTALSGRPSLRTVRADFPHSALQLSAPVVGVEIPDVSLFE